MGKGDAGNVAIDVLETIRLDGVRSDTEGTNPSSISSDVLIDGLGQSGTSMLQRLSLEIVNGAGIDSSVFGKGDAGNVDIDILETVRVDGINSVTGISPSSISSNIRPGAEGQGGNIRVAAANVEVTNGGQIDTSIFGEGDAGSVLTRCFRNYSH